MALLRAIFLWKNKEMFHVKRQYSFPGFAKNDFDLCTQARPYRLARHGTSRPKAKRLIAFSRRYAPKNTIRLPPSSGAQVRFLLGAPA